MNTSTVSLIIIPTFHFVFWGLRVYFRATLRDTHGFFLDLHSVITSAEAWKTICAPDIQAASELCKASTLPVLLSLWSFLLPFSIAFCFFSFNFCCYCCYFVGNTSSARGILLLCAQGLLLVVYRKPCCVWNQIWSFCVQYTNSANELSLLSSFLSFKYRKLQMN